MVVARRPPKMMAEMGTPSGSSQSGSMVGHCAAGAVKRPLGCAALAPVSLAICGVQRLPRQSMQLGGRLVGHAFPPDVAVGGERDVGEDGVAGERGHGVGIGLGVGAGGDAEEAGFGVDGAEPAVGVGLDPGDVVADGPDLPAFEACGRDQHGEVGLAAGAGEGGGDVGLLARRGISTPRMSMCSAIQPSSRAMLEAMRRAKHFLPSSALPP